MIISARQYTHYDAFYTSRGEADLEFVFLIIIVETHASHITFQPTHLPTQ
jgi:hypothetical protein